MGEPIVIEWEEWRASREMKREALRRAGLDAPSRRKSPVGTSDLRLRRAFGDCRVPNWAERANVPCFRFGGDTHA